MKTIEEKARAYDEALEKAKDMLKYKEVRVEDMEYLFPELKESEDEKIRKYIIRCISEWWDRCGDPSPDYPTREKMLSWLEKQGQQKPAWSEEHQVRQPLLTSGCRLVHYGQTVISVQTLQRMTDYSSHGVIP